MNFNATNEHLPHKQLGDLVVHLKKTIPNFPDISKKAISYDYESAINVISLTWDRGYDISEDHDSYILDLDSEGKIIGVELVNYSRLKS